MRRHGKIDTTQKDIVDALRACGASVEILSDVGAGCPDLLVGFHKMNVLMECKTGKKNLTEDQVVWMSNWMGAKPHVVRSKEQALIVIGVLPY